ncbi:MAG: MarR family transcriptional regulator [Candidatus Aminicenantes bacterium]|nr:MarR family transcriptional regulator [Candidatus Aminicenantes bacterium]
MSSYLYFKGVRIFDYPRFAEPFREQIRENAEAIARENNVSIEFVRKEHIRKEDIVAAKIKERGDHPGLVHIISAMEGCPSYRPWHDKTSGKTYLKGVSGKCLHYYFYLIDEDFGLVYVRVPTWCPFTLQIYFNGHNWLSGKLKKAGIQHELADNALMSISDWTKAQAMSDEVDIKKLHARLDEWAKRFCPVLDSFEQQYHWSVMQVEYATDIVFHKQESLQAIYPDLFKTAIHTVTPDLIATFLGKKITNNLQCEMGNNYHVRLEGRRVKHVMGPVSIKMYDKFAQILRIEVTVNNLNFLKHYRRVEHKDGSRDHQFAAFKKNIYSLAPLQDILKAINQRYIDFISQIETRDIGRSNLNKISQSITENNHHYKGINFFDDDDNSILMSIIRGEQCIRGFQNKNLRERLNGKTSTQVSRLLKRLKVHGIIKKARDSYRYHVTAMGRSVILTALKLKECLIIPELNCIRAKS